jgi:acetolactate synthase-1/2/3 large subunit
MKLSDYVADFIAKLGIKHVFSVTGGASIHLIDSLAKHSETDFICPHHEQAGAMAADAYARVTGNLGAALATSGPGATNLITGICGAWFDSIPVLYLTGQVTTFRFRGTTGVRQMGFQETPIVEIVEPITKYSVLVTDPMRIKYELEKAVYLAKQGRPGPVLVDIPDDLQRGELDTSDLIGFDPVDGEVVIPPVDSDLKISACVDLIKNAKRPVLVVGAGVRLAGAVDKIQQLSKLLGFPICPSWAALDMFSNDDPLTVGGFGTHGTRYGNFTIQNSDLVLAIGARLSSRETGSPPESWAREAKTIIVDIDGKELGKFDYFKNSSDISICADAGVFISALLDGLQNFNGQDISPWRTRVADWKSRYPVCQPEYSREESVNPYVFVKELSEQIPEDELIFSDTGCTIAWLAQAFEFSGKQRLIHAFNNTPMGYALPAAIGGCFANNSKPATCVVGDGSLMFNIQELATLRHHNLPIRLLILNNQGYSMVKQTQEQWFDGRYHATTKDGGLGFPDFTKIADAFGIPALTLDQNSDITSTLEGMYGMPGPVICDVRIPSEHGVIPQSKFGRPIEDSEPLLPRDEFLANMIVKPLPASLSD